MTNIYRIIMFSFLIFGGKNSVGAGWQPEGNFQGTVAFGGTLMSYDTALPPWVWKTGGYTEFSNKISELTDNGTRLTVKSPYDVLLLAGKSGRAFEGSVMSGARIVPVIQLEMD